MTFINGAEICIYPEGIRRRSFKDCYSFARMSEPILSAALTADKDFDQYGYKILRK